MGIDVQNLPGASMEKICKDCGISNPVYKNSYKLSKWSKEVRERDNYICQKCNVTHLRNELHAHYILSKPKHRDLMFNLDNGITLCHECHIIEHKNNGLL